jgi:hypothetical protein
MSRLRRFYTFRSNGPHMPECLPPRRTNINGPRPRCLRNFSHVFIAQRLALLACINHVPHRQVINSGSE